MCVCVSMIIVCIISSGGLHFSYWLGQAGIVHNKQSYISQKRNHRKTNKTNRKNHSTYISQTKAIHITKKRKKEKEKRKNKEKQNK